MGSTATTRSVFASPAFHVSSVSPVMRSTLIQRGALVLALILLTLSGAAAAASVAGASEGGLRVAPHPVSGPGLSYFKITARPGRRAFAGRVQVTNQTSAPMWVLFARVDGLTIDTLGSSYAPASTKIHGSTHWLLVRRRKYGLSPGASVWVPVSVRVPPHTRPGDYLSGISVEALNQRPRRQRRGQLSIVSVSRYAIGVEVTVPGRRRSLIRFTGAAVRREPSGMAFELYARNLGNTILQNVHGHVRITRAGHTVLARTISAGTFVAGTSIAYPVPLAHQAPSQPTDYGVIAWLRYPGGIARLNTTVSYGEHQARLQALYGGPRLVRPRHSAWKAIAGVGGALAALGGLGLGMTFLRRRRLLSRVAGLRLLGRSLAKVGEGASPVGLIVLVPTLRGLEDSRAARRLAERLRPKLRRGDRAVDLGGGALMIVLPETGARATEALREALGEFLDREGGANGFPCHMTSATAERPMSADELLRAAAGVREPQPA
ncbi:MAG TPA: hypothetical protein VGX16_02095 [Solirubrobacteraceae bacterium]|nr:hypothetical protein [Solirubrobacteraceae bacterium]